MDSLRLFRLVQGIPVEYELDTFNTPPQEQLYVIPKIGYVDAMPYFRSRHLALNSPLGHFNGDNARLSPNHQTHKTHGDSKVHFLQRQTWLSLNYNEHNPSHVQRYALLLNYLITPFRLLTHNLSYETYSTKIKSNILSCK